MDSLIKNDLQSGISYLVTIDNSKLDLYGIGHKVINDFLGRHIVHFRAERAQTFSCLPRKKPMSKKYIGTRCPPQKRRTLIVQSGTIGGKRTIHSFGKQIMRNNSRHFVPPFDDSITITRKFRQTAASQPRRQLFQNNQMSKRCHQLFGSDGIKSNFKHTVRCHWLGTNDNTFSKSLV